MEPIRERIDDLMRRYWYEGKRVFRVLAVAVAILLRSCWRFVEQRHARHERAQREH